MKLIVITLMMIMTITLTNDTKYVFLNPHTKSVEEPLRGEISLT